MAVIVADSPPFVRATLTTLRITRTLLAFVCLIQLLRSQISYYQLVAVAIMYHLLAIPEHMTINFKGIFKNENTPYYNYEHGIKVMGFILSVPINSLAAFISFNYLMGGYITCVEKMPGLPIKVIDQPSLFAPWGTVGGRTNTILMLNYIVADGLLALNKPDIVENGWRIPYDMNTLIVSVAGYSDC
jgi:hypothetical protein